MLLEPTTEEVIKLLVLLDGIALDDNDDDGDDDDDEDTTGGSRFASGFASVLWKMPPMIPIL